MTHPMFLRAFPCPHVPYGSPTKDKYGTHPVTHGCCVPRRELGVHYTMEVVMISFGLMLQQSAKSGDKAALVIGLAVLGIAITLMILGV